MMFVRSVVACLAIAATAQAGFTPNLGNSFGTWGGAYTGVGTSYTGVGTSYTGVGTSYTGVGSYNWATPTNWATTTETTETPAATTTWPSTYNFGSYGLGSYGLGSYGLGAYGLGGLGNYGGLLNYNWNVPSTEESTETTDLSALLGLGLGNYGLGSWGLGSYGLGSSYFGAGAYQPAYNFGAYNWATPQAPAASPNAPFVESANLPASGSGSFTEEFYLGVGKLASNAAGEAEVAAATEQSTASNALAGFNQNLFGGMNLGGMGLWGR
jgi:hypothetical protein